MNKETEEAIAKAVAEAIEALPKYALELVYVDYRDELSDKQINAMVQGDWETLDNDANYDDWTSEQRHHSSTELLGEILKDLENDDWDEDVLQEWRDTDSWLEAQMDIMDRDTSNPLKALAHNTGQVMLRIEAIDEDNAWSFEPIEVNDLLMKIGLPITPDNRTVAADIINNTSPEYGVSMGYWLASVSVGDLYDLLMTQEVNEIRLTNPGFWLGNPFAGNGYADQFEGSVIVKREDLRTDKGAFGYGWQEVAGCYASAFPTKMEVNA